MNAGFIIPTHHPGAYPDISYHLHCPLVSLLPQPVCAQFAKILTFSSVVRISDTVFLYHHYSIIILLGPHSLLY